MDFIQPSGFRLSFSPNTIKLFIKIIRNDPGFPLPAIWYLSCSVPNCDFRLMKREMKGTHLIPLIILLAFVLGQVGCESLKSENERLKGEITDVNSENEKLKNELSALRSENSKMHIHLAELNLQVARLHQEIQSLQKDVDSFKAQLKNSDRKKKS